MDYTQSLYEKKLVSYPRTDSRYLTEDMEENQIKIKELPSGDLEGRYGAIPVFNKFTFGEGE